MSERKKIVVKLPQEYLDKDVPELNEHSDTDEAQIRQGIASLLLGGPGMLPAKLGGKALTNVVMKAAPKHTKALARTGLNDLNKAGTVGSVSILGDLASTKSGDEGDDERATDAQRRRATLEESLPLPAQYAAIKKSGGKVGKKSKPIGVGQALRGYGAVRKRQ